MVRLGSAESEGEVAGEDGGEAVKMLGVFARADVTTEVEGMGGGMSNTVVTYEPSEPLHKAIERPDALLEALVTGILVRVVVLRVNATVLAHQLLIPPILPLLQRATEDEVVAVGFRGGGATLLGDGDTTDGTCERSTTTGDEDAAIFDTATAGDEGGVEEIGMGVGVGRGESMELGLTALSTDCVLLAVALVLMGEGTIAAVEWAAEAMGRHGESGVKTEGVW